MDQRIAAPGTDYDRCSNNVLVTLAEDGDAWAQNALGYRNYHGLDGFQIDYDRAVALFTIAADKNFGRAQNNLAICYLNGHGVDYDPEKAAVLFKAAADTGLPEAMYNLGSCYRKGLGVVADSLQAVGLFEAAARAEFAPAQLMMGLCCLDEYGGASGRNKGVRWLQRAADQGVVNAMWAILKIAGNTVAGREQPGGAHVSDEEIVAMYRRLAGPRAPTPQPTAG